MSTEGIRGTTQLTGVFGYPVSHSASPQMHNAAFRSLGLDWRYIPFAVAPANIEQAISGIRALGLRGVNVTVPLKELVAPLMDDLTPRARALGAVNTVTVKDGRLIGDSTDGDGFLQSLAHRGLDVSAGLRVVVIGAGGSGRAVALALAQAGAEVVIVNRNHDRAEALVRELGAFGKITAAASGSDSADVAFARANLLVNTTSVGMSPNVSEMPEFPVDCLTPDLFVYDLIYNPAETILLRTARVAGCHTENGVEMLVRQGALSFSQWTGILSPPVDVMRAAVQNALSRASS